MQKEKLVVILGPTATGKSRCGIRLAQELDGEIISGDSMLVYRQMNIGTAKPSASELALVPHHLVDILPPDALFSVVDFTERAAAAIKAVNARGRLPILVGGTGLYLRALLEDYQFSSVPENQALRRELEQFAKDNGVAALHARLQALEPAAAQRLHPNDVRRVVRALETALAGETVSREKETELAYDATVFGLSMERSFLYERINRRVDQMVQQGLEQEVRRLLASGVPADALSMKSLGYRQMAEYLAGDYDLSAAIDHIKKGTRHFDKRQITWYKQMPYVHWFLLDRSLNYEKIVADMVSRLVENSKKL